MDDNSSSLPVTRYAKDILETVKLNPITIVIGETGSGKTTQIAQILDKAGYTRGGSVAVTQPRRVAAVTVARRVAQELGCQVGRDVGYAIRFEELTSKSTRIVYLTDGTLLRLCLDDEELNQHSVIVLDEAHERSLNTDILFALVKHLVRRRKKPLKVVITSATLNGEKFSAYFDDCPVLTVPGRVFDVQLVHSKENHESDILTAAVETALQIHLHEPPGDILVFLTGQAEIDKAVSKLKDEVAGMDPEECRDVVVLPLYAALPPDQQVRVFARAPAGCRRIVVATNIAETSITVDGVVYVVDAGRVKLKAYNPQTGIDTLSVVPISRVQAIQRAGRAGRTQPGKCFRLYTRAFFEREMAEATVPEIQRTSLLTAVLYLKSLPLDIDILHFDFLDAPSRPALEDALRQLYILDCLDADGRITALGRRLAKLPLEPSLGRLLAAAAEMGCLEQALSLCAMLTAESIFLGSRGPEQLVNDVPESQGRGERRGAGLSAAGRERLQEFMADGQGDHILYLRLFEAWVASGESARWAQETGLDIRGLRFARDVRRQLAEIAGPDGWNLLADQSKAAQPSKLARQGDRSDALRRAVLTGYANKIARRIQRHNGYKTLGPRGVLAQLHPSTSTLALDEDGMLPQWVAFHELLQTARTFISKVCPVEEDGVAQLLDKLHNVDVNRLSGGTTTEEAKQVSLSPADPALPAMVATAQERRNDQSRIMAARERFLARKKTRLK